MEGRELGRGVIVRKEKKGIKKVRGQLGGMREVKLFLRHIRYMR